MSDAPSEIAGRAARFCGTGNTEPACTHFSHVLARWGHSTPRSVTADEARAHARKLRCPSQ